MSATGLSVRSGEFASPRLFRLAGPVMAVAWDVPRPAGALAPLVLDDHGARIAPASSVRLPLQEGGTRVLVAFPCPPGGPAGLRIQATMLSPAAPVTGEAVYAADLFQDPAVAADLTVSGRRLLLAAIASTWPSLFRLGARRSYGEGASRLIGLMAGETAPIRALGTLPDGGLVVEATLPAGTDAIEDAHVVAPGRVGRVPGRACCVLADPAGRSTLAHLVIEPADAPGVIVFRTARGPIVRALPVAPRRVPIGRWWTSRAAGHARLRPWLVDAVARRSDAGAALARELQLGSPLPAACLRAADGLPSAGIDVAIGTDAGLFVAGWRHDPENLIADMALLRPDGSRRSLTPDLESFPGHLPGPDGRVRQAAGFVGLLGGPDLGADLQPRFLVRLLSGTEIPLVPEPQPADPVAKRRAIAAGVPPQHLTTAMLERCFGPAFAALQARIKAARGAPVSVEIGRGPEAPRTSIVVPLYRVLDFLRAQVGAFAADPQIRSDCEIVYVLDSPEQAGACEHLLRGLEMTYGLPLRLVVMARNGGFSAACNAGAAASRGDVIVFVNSDVLPSAPGWLLPLCAGVAPGRGAGAAGPRLLFADGSLQHAGLFFKKDRTGRWLNHHYWKGLPGRYAPAAEARSVPGVTGACVAVPRAVFDAVGGFTEDFIVGDYEDSDLCLKIRAAGYDIVYEPAATLYHLERQSIGQSVDYTDGIASQHNAWLQTRRWDDAIADLMARFDPARAADDVSVALAAIRRKAPTRRLAPSKARPGGRRRSDDMPAPAPSRALLAPLQLAGFGATPLVVRADFDLVR